jgi:hypothetical protein
MTASCCADCGKEEGEGDAVSLKVCKACMLVKYCNAECQRKHWPTHKKECKLRAAELRDEALFMDPPPKEDCPICFLPMTRKIISCISLSPATISSVPIYDYAEANEEFATKQMKDYYPCCGKSICAGCEDSFNKTGNDKKCPFCNSERYETDEQHAVEIRRRMEKNDPTSTCLLAHSYHHGLNGLQQDHAKSIDLYTRGPQILVIVRRIVNWPAFIVKGEI